ncbi:MAG: hypothetical protein AAGA30_19280, partial [Planctomycetota bacterium]
MRTFVIFCLLAGVSAAQDPTGDSYRIVFTYCDDGLGFGCLYEDEVAMNSLGEVEVVFDGIPEYIGENVIGDHRFFVNESFIDLGDGSYLIDVYVSHVNEQGELANFLNLKDPPVRVWSICVGYKPEEAELLVNANMIDLGLDEVTIIKGPFPPTEDQPATVSTTMTDDGGFVQVYSFDELNRIKAPFGTYGTDDDALEYFTGEPNFGLAVGRRWGNGVALLNFIDNATSGYRIRYSNYKFGDM